MTGVHERLHADAFSLRLAAPVKLKPLTSIKTLPPSSAMKFDMEGVEMYHFN
jgi:hypothetical protein